MALTSEQRKQAEINRDLWNRESGINIAKALDSYFVIPHNISQDWKWMPSQYDLAGIYIFSDNVILCRKQGSETSIIQL